MRLFCLVLISFINFCETFLKMDNAEEIFHFLEEFSKRKPKIIPQELNDYLAYVARTGDPVYQWALVKSLFKEKLLNVITDFYETSPGIDIPPYPNVDPFNYDTMKNSLLERLDSFTSAPFTVQRICELLTYPRKQYNRVDKFMRAIEKNILVVSTREPGLQRHIEAENGEPMEPIVNGSDNNSEYNVDVEMEDMSWKENSEPHQSSEPQPSSSDTHISVDDIEARLKAKQDATMETNDKITTQYESVTPPEPNVTADEQITETKSPETSHQQPTTSTIDEQKIELPNTSNAVDKPKMDVEMKTEESNNQPLIIPEIKVDDVEMTEQRLNEQVTTEKTLTESSEKVLPEINDSKPTAEETQSNVDQLTGTDKPLSIEENTNIDNQTNIDHQTNIDESSSDSNSKEEPDNKHLSEVQTSSEESSSSSDNTDGNSNSPKAVENTTDMQEESSQSDSNTEEEKQVEPEKPVISETPQPTIQNDNYSISDMNSELPQPKSDESKSNEPLKDETENSVVKQPDATQENNEVGKENTEKITENESS